MLSITGCIVMLAPPLLSLVLRERLWGSYKSAAERLRDYAAAVFLVNAIGSTLSFLVFGNEFPVDRLMAVSAIFGLKYALLSVCLSAALPYVAWHLRDVRLEADLESSRKVKWVRLAAIFALVLLGVHAIRLSNFDFWGDEAFSVVISRLSLPGMIARTASDVHPPLYYMILMLATHLLGDHGWVYNLVSYAPYAITMVLCLTVIWKRYGGAASMTVMALYSFTTAGVVFITEVRMYSWAALFVLVAFLALHRVFERGRAVDYIVFTAAALAASYTHYYAFLTCALMYLVMLVRAFLTRRDIAKAIASSVAATAGYLPWVAMFLRAFERTSESFWIDRTPGLGECMRYAFTVGDGSNAKWLVMLFFATLAFVLATRAGFIELKREDGKKTVSFSAVPRRDDPMAWWVIAGLVAIVGTIVVGIVVSYAIRPLLFKRYLFPAAGLAWLLLGVGVASLGRLRIPALAVVLCLVMGAGVPALKQTVETERGRDRAQDATRAALANVSAGDMMLTSNAFLKWTVLEACFPGVETAAFGEVPLEDYDARDVDWFIVEREATEKELQWAADGGYSLEKMIGSGNLGTVTVWAYRVVPEQDADGRDS